MDPLTLRRLLTVLAAAVAGVLVAALGARAQTEPPTTTAPTATTTTPARTTPARTPRRPAKLVTYAARTCSSYTDVTANLARNDIQESLRDLGADTLYVGGEPISPAKEQQGQPNCRPLTAWRFHLGTGYQTRAVTGDWGSLSKVTGPYSTSIVTRDAVPLLDAQGKPTGTTLAGAVTVGLTDEQVDRASTGNSLWLQGGDVEDPVLDQLYPNQYGFAALRCAVDNLNGDNVEWIGFPSGTDHVFCFAYYVQPPPTSGTIVVRKVVDDADATAAQTFTFKGNISYTSDHRFSLSAANGAPDEVEFFRGAVGPSDPPWSITEEVPDGWTLTGLECVSATGASTAATDLATGRADVTLAANDTVTCTYTNRLQPPPSGLQLGKRTIGGTGAFGFAVTGEEDAEEEIATRAPSRWFGGDPLSLPAGLYEVSEQLPAPTPAGRWRTTQVICDGAEEPANRPATVTLPAGSGATCGFTNTFVPGGALVVRKTTLGRTGDAGFTIARVGGAPASYDQTAQVRRTGQPTLARGDDTTQIPLGTYRITEFALEPPEDGAWTLQSVVCNGRPVPAARGQAEVTLNAAQPRLDCTFTNRYDPDATPVPPPAPDPGPEPDPDPPTPTPTPEPPPDDNSDASTDDLDPADGPFADLAVTKSVTPAEPRIGERAHYEVVVVNRGPDPATDVVVTEIRPRGTQTLNLQTTRGTCDGRRPARCEIGTLRPGQRAVIITDVRPVRVGAMTNRVATVSSTADPRLSNNRAQARIRVRRPEPAAEAAPTYTG